MTALAALKLVLRRIFPKSKREVMLRSRSVSLEPCAYGYMPSDTVFTPIIEVFNAPPEPPLSGNASGVRRMEEGRAGYYRD